MPIRCFAFASALSLAAAWSVPVFAQEVPTPPLQETLANLTTPLAAPSVAEAIGLATALEVANAPFGSSAGGFVFKLDPATGLRVRTAPTFGPSFAERALTAGEGKVSFGANLIVATYDKLNEFDLEQMHLTTAEALPARETGFASLVLSSETVVLSGVVGATDSLDIGVSVPFVKVKLDGLSWAENERGLVIRHGALAQESSGLGDVAFSAKYRVLRFGEGQPDPGGVALQLITRLPTGQRENFRGLGITRVLGAVVLSAGVGKLRPHANVGFEWWAKGLGVDTNFVQETTGEARHQVHYAAGLELEAGQKVTILLDVLGRHTLGGGTVAREVVPVPPDLTDEIDLLELTRATERGIRKWTLVPGLKWNMKGSVVLSTNALISLSDNGLRDFFTPVIGLDFTF